MSSSAAIAAVPPVRRRPERAIDMMHLAKQALGDPGLELEILRAFDEATGRHFAELQHAASVPDILHHLNALKGASIGVGAWGLAERAHVLQRDLRGGAPADPELVRDIGVAVAEVQAFVADRLARAGETL